MASISGTAVLAGDPDDWIVTAHDAATHAYAGESPVVNNEYLITGLTLGGAYILVFRNVTGGVWTASNPIGAGGFCVPTNPVDTPYIYKNTTTNGDAYGNSVGLLLRMNGEDDGTTFTDESKYGHTVTRAGAVTKTGTKKYGTASAYFDGDGDYLSIADHASLELGGLDFNIEMWIKTTATLQYATLLSRNVTGFSEGSWTLMINSFAPSAGDVAVWLRDYTNLNPLLITTGVNVRDDSWHHICWTRSGTSHNLIIDGTTRASTVASVTVSNLSSNIFVGYDNNYSRAYTGYIDDLRMTVGAARPYSVPDAELPKPIFTGLSEPTWPIVVGNTVVDNAVEWTNMGRMVRPLAHGPYIAG